MLQYLLFFLITIPVSAVAQTVNAYYLEQKLDEASVFHRQFDYQQSNQVLNTLYALSLKEKNYYAASIALIKQIHYKISHGDYSKSEPNWQEIEKLIQQAPPNNATLRIQLLKLKASWYQAKGDHYSEAYKLLDECVRLCESNSQHQSILAEIFYMYGQMKAKSSLYVEANNYFLKALRIYDQLNNEAAAGQLYGELANTAFLMGEKKRAIDYAEMGIEAMKKQKDYEELIVQLSNLGRIYQLTGDTANAIAYFKESAEYAPKSAKKETRFINLVDLALVYHAKKDRENALANMEMAIDEGRKISQPKLHRYIRMGAMFAGYTNNETLMNKYYQESFALAQKDSDRDALRDWNASQNFYYSQIKKDLTKAYPFLEKFHLYKDSIINESSRKNFNELEIQYQSEKKQTEINRLATAQKIQQLELEKKNALLRGNAIEAAQKEKEIQLLTQEKLISNLKIEQQAKTISLNEATVKNLEQQKKIAAQESLLKEEKIQNEQLERNLILAILLAAIIIFLFILNRTLLKKKLEQKKMLLSERSRISSELHDEVGSTLTAINLLSYAAINQLQDQVQKVQVQKIRENTQAVMDNISDIVWSMNPDNDNFAQTVVRMKEFTANVLEPQNIQYHFQVAANLEKIKLSPEKRRDIYLIFKEAVNNLAKYAQASQVTIILEKSKQMLAITIQDNGTGFDIDNKKEGNGLRNMKYRSERQNGRLSIKSSTNGTTVFILYPYA